MVDFSAMLLLVLGFARGMWGWVTHEFKRAPWETRMVHLRQLRCVIAVHILFALELMIVSDLIETVLIIVEHSPGEKAFFSSPVFYELAQLAIVVLIRTFIDYFLSKEIRSLDDPSLA